MEKKLLLGIALGLSVISLANAPERGLNKEFVKKNLETRLEIPDNKYVQELKDFYKQQIYNERNYITEVFTKDREEVLLARMLFGEVAGRPKWEKMEIGSTTITRMTWGLELKKAILFPKAYSCFNSDANRLHELKNPLRYSKAEFLNCLEVSKELLQMKYKSLGATHYYNPDIVEKPEWAEWMTFVGKVGPHLMYK
jgi:hypothetical protein